MLTRVCVIGHFGEGQTLLNGQTIKTKIVTEELQNQFGCEQVMKVDTHGGWKVLLKSPVQLLHGLKNSRNVVIFPAHNGLRVYAPMLSWFKSFFKGRKIHYVVIGGWLPEFLGKRKSLAKALKKFDGIYVETNTMKNALEAQGFENVFVMPNCKKLTILSENALIYPSGEPYKLCTFSRVMKEKGIEDAINAVRTVNEQFGRTVYELDIYGQIDPNQIKWFDELQKSFPKYIRYKGLVDFNKSVETLKDYYVLLFPTYYDGEGFAGTLIDAFSAGVPVIASDWKYNSEIVNDTVGEVYMTGVQSTLIESLKRAAINSERILKKKKFCLQEAEKYEPDRAIRVLLNQLSDNLKDSVS